MRTFQDFEKEKQEGHLIDFLRDLISEHRSSPLVKIALDADAYDRQENLTIKYFVQTIFNSNGMKVENFTASNSHIASNFFNTLNTQRTNYSLGNGVTFRESSTKDKLGIDFDTVLKKAARYSLIHGVSFVFFNKDRCHYFKITEFAPLYDESTGILRAGVRFYQIDHTKPMTAVLYEEDGITVYRAKDGEPLLEIQPKHGYVKITERIPIEEDTEIIGYENYGPLPIVPLWGSDLKQSTLVGMRESIDSYDLIRSGFANDLRDCAQVYWIVSGAMGMTPKEMQKFRDRLLIEHIGIADTDNSSVTPFTQDIPYQARTAYLEQIKKQIYEDFGGMNVSDFASGEKTATEIQAAYQPVDDRADDFEYQIIQTVQQILRLIGVEDTPIFKRNRITNQLEQVQLVMLEAEYLDDETLLGKLPNITPDEIQEILKRKDAQDASRMQYNVSGRNSENGDSENEQENNNNQ